MLRTHTCGELRKKDANKKVDLCGWIDSIRTHGNVIFIDLRDRYGITQLVFEKALKKEIEVLKKESVIRASGVVKQKPEPNKKLETGDIEVVVDSFKILGESDILPIDLENPENMEEETRLKWRYLDLRRPKMQRNLILRHKTFKVIRDALDEMGFLEIETPVLAKPTPEGARDYLVPSRVNPGKFFALPQSPQLFKQILMVSGFDRYVQFARCYRDEELRADRQPEFTQLDIEMSFVEEEDIYNVVEAILKQIWKKVLKTDIKTPFPRLTQQEAMDRYGSDKPDTRFGFELINLNEEAKNSGFGIFEKAIESRGAVKAINAKGCSNFTRKDIEELEKVAKIYGAKGLAWLKVEESLEGPFVKHVKKDILDKILKKTNAVKGDLILFVADHKHFIAETALGNVRLALAKKLNLIDEKKWNFLWVFEFPLLEYDEDEKRHVAVHHPFTSPKIEDLKFLDTHPVKVRARAYDVVLNGIELGGGSIRIHEKQLQQKMFHALGISAEEAEKKFGFLMNAFKYGAPPHGGIALGLDRLMSLICGEKTIREVIAFPKTKNAEDLMMGSPSDVDKKQLAELHIGIKTSNKK